MKSFCQKFFLRALLPAVLAAVSQSVFAAPSALDYSDISKPEFFPILPWDQQHGREKFKTDARENGLESIAECHFNMAGFVWPSDLAHCKKLGLGAIIMPAKDSEIAWDNRHGWSKLSDAEIESRVKRIIEAAGNSSVVKGYFIQDEPGVREFSALGKAVAAVKKFAPGKLAYINLFPNYATIGAPDMSQLGTSNYTEYLERFVNEVHPQMISYDNYMVQMSMDMTLPDKAASYYRNLLEVRRVAQKYKLPYLNIVSANQIRSHTTIPSPANLLFQAYTTLAAGYRGVTWYTYYTKGFYGYAAIDKNGRRTQTWPYLAEVNRQVATLAPIMSRLESTGVFFSAPLPVEGLPQLPGEIVASVTCAAPLMIGEFKNSSGEKFLMVVNLSLEKSAKFTLTTKTNEKINFISSIDGSSSGFDEKAGLWLVAGQGILLQLVK